jgi:membrane associated rhomboid family serine protease
VVTIAIIVICVIVYVFQQANPSLIAEIALIPMRVGQRPWQLITSAFAHASVLHILMNMWAVWAVGSYLEQILGRWRYVALYVLSALGGSVGVLAWTQMTQAGYATVTVGASGAIFGLFGAILLVSKRLRQNITGIVTVIVINVAYSFVVAGVSWQGHFGGLIIGLVLGAIFAYAPSANRKAWSVGGVVVITGGLVAAGAVLGSILAA